MGAARVRAPREYRAEAAGDDAWAVTGGTEPYTVRRGPWRCTCDAFKYHGGKPCKHIRFVRGEPMAEPKVETEEAPRARPAPPPDPSADFLREMGVIRHPDLPTARLGLLAEVDYIQKTKGPDGKGPGYAFAGEAAVVGAMHAACVRHGLTITPSEFKILHREEYASKAGSQMVRTVVQATYVVRHAFSGECEALVSLGEAADVGDKATPKALSIAYKYALRQLNLIETGLDPDTTPAEAVAKPSRPMPPAAPPAAFDAPDTRAASEALRNSVSGAPPRPAANGAGPPAKIDLARAVQAIAGAKDVEALKAMGARLKAREDLGEEAHASLRKAYRERMSDLAAEAEERAAIQGEGA